MRWDRSGFSRDAILRFSVSSGYDPRQPSFVKVVVQGYG